jgi:hypothetical protein
VSNFGEGKYQRIQLGSVDNILPLLPTQSACHLSKLKQGSVGLFLVGNQVFDIFTSLYLSFLFCKMGIKTLLHCVVVKFIGDNKTFQSA